MCVFLVIVYTCLCAHINVREPPLALMRKGSASFPLLILQRTTHNHSLTTSLRGGKMREMGKMVRGFWWNRKLWYDVAINVITDRQKHWRVYEQIVTTRFQTTCSRACKTHFTLSPNGSSTCFGVNLIHDGCHRKVLLANLEMAITWAKIANIWYGNG